MSGVFDCAAINAALLYKKLVNFLPIFVHTLVISVNIMKSVSEPNKEDKHFVKSKVFEVSKEAVEFYLCLNKNCSKKPLKIET